MVCFRQFWCLNMTSVWCSDKTCTGLSGSLGHLQLSQCSWGAPRTATLTPHMHWTHCLLAGLESLEKKCSWDFGERLKPWGEKFLARQRCLKNRNISAPVGWIPNELKLNKCFQDRAGVLQKTLCRQAGFLRRAVLLLSVCLPVAQRQPAPSQRLLLSLSLG